MNKPKNISVGMDSIGETTTGSASTGSASLPLGEPTRMDLLEKRIEKLEAKIDNLPALIAMGTTRPRY